MSVFSNFLVYCCLGFSGYCLVTLPPLVDVSKKKVVSGSHSSLAVIYLFLSLSLSLSLCVCVCVCVCVLLCVQLKKLVPSIHLDCGMLSAASGKMVHLYDATEGTLSPIQVHKMHSYSHTHTHTIHIDTFTHSHTPIYSTCKVGQYFNIPSI